VAAATDPHGEPVSVQNMRGWLLAAASRLTHLTPPYRRRPGYTSVPLEWQGALSRSAARLGPAPVSAATRQLQLTVAARGAALLIAEFARRRIARGADWARIIGA
jgi:hypothetical protein